MYTISKEFEFCASHNLCDLEVGHPCMRVHGHNYKITVELQSRDVDPKTGMVLDYRKLKPIKEWLDETFDHRHLNDLSCFTPGSPHYVGNPTAENIAKFIYNQIPRIFGFSLPSGVDLKSITVKETDKTAARYGQ